MLINLLEPGDLVVRETVYQYIFQQGLEVDCVGTLLQGDFRDVEGFDGNNVQLRNALFQERSDSGGRLHQAFVDIGVEAMATREVFG